MRGSFVVLEGVDGAGTTTHAKRLRASLGDMGLPATGSCEPSDGPIGSMIRQALTGRLVVPGLGGSQPPSWQTMALLFAADRSDHLQAKILPNLAEGVNVVCDRYDYSSVAYQSLTGGGTSDAVAWVKELNRHALRPDLTVVLDVTVDEAARRRNRRTSSPELYDDADLQSQLVAFYEEIERHYPDDTIVHVDANGPEDRVHAAILAEVQALRGHAVS